MDRMKKNGIRRYAEGTPGERLYHFRHSISTKIVLIMIVLILPVNVMAITLGKRTMDSMVEQAGMSVKTVLNNTMAGLENRMRNTQYLLYDSRYKNPDGLILVRQAGDSAHTSAKIRLYYDLKADLDRLDAAEVLFFYMMSIDDLLVWDTRSMHRQEDKQYIREIIAGGESKGWHLEVINGASCVLLTMQLKNLVYGGWIDLEDVFRTASKSIAYETAKLGASTEEPGGTAGKLTVSAVSGSGKIWLSAEIDRKEIIGRVRGIYSLISIGSFIALFLIPVLYLLIQYLLLSPLKSLSEGHDHVRRGDLDYRITRKSSSIEYNHVFHSFNEMTATIQTLKIENYEQQLAKQQLELNNQSLELANRQLELDNQSLELKNLRLQIHPHFLLNTFNLIYTLAKRGKSEEIQKAIVFLSDYFRYLFRSENHLELFGKEQHIVESYIEVARLRYPGCIDAEFQYDPELAYVRIPPLLIQNFVENIVKYAADQERVTHISIVGQYEDGFVSFMIMDDGPGIPEERIREIYETMQEQKDRGTHIGYYNSFHRLKHFYGEGASLDVASDPGEGTCVTICFPYDLEPDPAEEVQDRIAERRGAAGEKK